MKNPQKPTQSKRKGNNDAKRRNSVREIPARKFCPAYFDELEKDDHIKAYAVIKDVGYMDDISYIIQAVIR